MPETPETKSIQVNLRCTYEEEEALKAAADAIPTTVSRLVELGVIQALADLEMTFGDDAPPKRSLRPGFDWPFGPQRPDGESAKTRVTAYIPPEIYETMKSAAWSCRLSFPFFALGAALREVSILKRLNEKKKGKEQNAALAKVKVPYEFDELVRTWKL